MRHGSHKRILYVQFSNPAGYPPLEHSARIIADAGWDVLFLGTGAMGTGVLSFLPHQRITLRQMRFVSGGFLQKLSYLCFVVWVLGWTVRWRPGWIYASDPLACPIAWLAQRLLGVRIAYHEHDTPDVHQRASSFMRIAFHARKSLARSDSLCILPNEGRVQRFLENTGRKRPVFCVWNCPLRDEAKLLRARRHERELVLYYHGNLSSTLLPLTVLKALAKVSSAVKLHVVGYETAGNLGFMDIFMKEAKRLGIESRVTHEAAMNRSKLLERAARFDIGLTLIPKKSVNPNLNALVGASNKVFDYLACGLMVLVPDLPQWRETFVETGVGMACDPEDADSIAQALAWCEQNHETVRQMGERGRQKILQEWNYERQFAPVLAVLEEAYA